MTTRVQDDIGLGQVLNVMCRNNDYRSVLIVLQTVSKLRRAGYLTINELTNCLIYCGNAFAENKNGEFFKEYVKYMPDINNISDACLHFTNECQSFYYVYKNADSLIDTIEIYCKNLDTATIKEEFIECMLDKNVKSYIQLKALMDKLKALCDEVTNDKFIEYCKKYINPYSMKTG